jgi:hypothetical protein
MDSRGRNGEGGWAVSCAEKEVAAFPNAEPVRPKTPRTGGAGLRRRWRDQQAGRIYEWDSQHGIADAYDDRGRHLGEFDPLSGGRLKEPDRESPNRDQLSVISRLESPIDNENLYYFLEA